MSYLTLRINKRVLYLILIFCALLVAGELADRGFQAWRHRSIEDSIFHPVFRHYYFFGPGCKPNARSRWQGIADMKINSLGFRGEEFNIQKAPGVFRIACFGASTTHAGDYPAKLQALLQQNPPAGYRAFEVIDAATPTWTTTQDLIQYVTRVMYLQPDLIVVFEAINDRDMTDNYWLYNLHEVEYRKYGGFLLHHSQLYADALALFGLLSKALADQQFLWHVRHERRLVETYDIRANFQPASTQVFDMDLTNFIALAKFHGSGVLLVTMPLAYDSRLNLRDNLLRVGRASGELSWVVNRVEQLNGRVRDLARQYGVECVDAAAAGMQLEPGNFVDVCHFSERGGTVFARLVEGGVRTYLTAHSKLK